jgi:hypothetical protein
LRTSLLASLVPDLRQARNLSRNDVRFLRSAKPPTEVSQEPKLFTIGPGRIYRHGVTNPGPDAGVDVSSFVAETAEQMHKQLAEVSAFIRGSLEDDIPELRGDARTIELLGASVEGNVDTVLNALRHGIAVERVEAPTTALEYARRLAQQGVPVNALVRAYRVRLRRMNERVFRELRAADMSAQARFDALEAIYCDALRVHRLDLPAGRRRVRGRARTMVGEPEQHPGVARPRGPGGTEGRRRRRDQQLDSLSVAVAPPRRGDVVSGRGRRGRRTHAAAALSS